MSPITTEVLQRTLSWSEYYSLARKIVAEEVPREGVYLRDNTFRYTGSNLKRMNHVLQFMTLEQKLYNLVSELKEEWLWLVISEPWCGDASWGTTALHLISSATEQIDFRILLRDTNMDVMHHYQTNEGDAIPKLICLRKNNMQELGTWGPRPQILQQQVNERMQQADFDYKESVRAIHAWYEADGMRALQSELIDLIKVWKEK